MSSETSETENWIIMSSLKDQENTDQGSPRKKGAGDLSHPADPCNNAQVVVSARKRRAGDDGEKPRKRKRSSNLINPTEQCQVSVEDNRKASVDARPPEKKTRSRVSNNNSEPKTASGTNCQLRSGKRKADSDGETPKKRARCSDRPNYTESNPEVKEEISEDQKIYSSTGKTSRADFEDTYIELEAIGAGGFGCVFSGIRKADGLPVAIKHIPSKNVLRRQVTCNGKIYGVCLEVAFMMKTSSQPESAAVSLLDWYNLEEELILVMEKPDQAMDLHKYRQAHGGSLDEDEAKMILRQLVDAAIDIHSKGVFHRDIKLKNVLIHDGSNGPRVRVIDFGCGTFSTKKSYHSFCGTFAIAPPEWFESRTYWACPTTVWQLGVVFYSLLNGHKRFTTRDFMNNHIKINKALSTEVKTLLHMCLARNPEERCTLEELQLSLARQRPSPPPTQGHL